jgi:hypothetical protein
MKLANISLGVAAALHLSSLSVAHGSAQRFSEAEARSVVTAYAKSAGYLTLRGFGIERFNPSSTGFFYYSAMIDDPEASAVVENFAVDRRSGDLWLASLCERRSSPLSRALQERLLAAKHITPLQYHRLKRPGPSC